MREKIVTNSKDLFSVSQAINLATHDLMKFDNNLVTFGLGINDPKRIFGTTSGLVETFGRKRVFDFPTSENSMTGYAIGLAINGIPSITIHQRFEFFLLAMDQVVNNAAKWYFMFGSQTSVPIVIRLVVGKGWGQGPTHSQSLHSWLAHVPGLKIVMPHDPQSAYDLLIDSVRDPNPVIYIEHRWIHEQVGTLVRRQMSSSQQSGLSVKFRKEFQGHPQVTIVSFSYLSSRVKTLYEILQILKIGFEHLTIETIQPYALQSIKESVKKSGRLLVLDFAARTGSFAKEIVGEISMSQDSGLICPAKILTYPDSIEPTSHYSTKNLYYDDSEIFRAILTLLDKDIDVPEIQSLFNEISNRINLTPHDVPNIYFKGPF